MVFTRMACDRGSRSPKRSAPMRPGARRRRNWRKPRSSDDASTRPTPDPEAPAALYFGEVMHARLKPIAHRFSYRVMSLLIDLDRLDEADRQSPLFGVNRAALYSFHETDHGERDGSSLRAYAQRRAAEHGIEPDRRARAAALLSAPARLHLQSALGLFLLWRRRPARADHLRGAQHLRRNPFLRAAGAARARSARPACGRRRTSCSTSRPSWKWRCAITSASRRPANRSSCASWRPTARGPCSPPPSRAAASRSTTSLAASRLRRAAAGHSQDRCSDPLASAAVVAQGRPAGAASAYRICEGAQYLLGERQKPRLYTLSAIRPRERALVR